MCLCPCITKCWRRFSTHLHSPTSQILLRLLLYHRLHLTFGSNSKELEEGELYSCVVYLCVRVCVHGHICSSYSWIRKKMVYIWLLNSGQLRMQQKLRKFSETICHKKNRKVHIVHNYHHHADVRFTHTHPHRSQGVESQLGERKMSLSKKERKNWYQWQVSYTCCYF